jgi:dolichol-phosphate mannosyltransferase
MKKNICVVIPCHKVKDKIFDVFKEIDFKLVDKLIIVDDCCPENSGKFLQKKIKKNKNNNKVNFIYLKNKLGVGGATLAGFKKAFKEKYKIFIKIDGDGQHETKFIRKFSFYLSKNYDFCKGYRELTFKKALEKKMPVVRYAGAKLLTLISRFTCNSNNIEDVVHGFFGIKKSFFGKLKIKNIRKNYFFEQDIIFNVLLNNGKVKQLKTDIIYRDEKSSLNPIATVVPFIYYHISNYLYRIRKN